MRYGRISITPEEMRASYSPKADKMQILIDVPDTNVKQQELKDKHKIRPLCYISGPMMSEGHAYANIGDAIELGEVAFERGYAPVIPHLDCLVSIVTGNVERSRYMVTDLSVLSKCSAVCVLPFKKEELINTETGEVTQTGTAEEIDFAQDWGIPVFTEETLPYVN